MTSTGEAATTTVVQEEQPLVLRLSAAPRRVFPHVTWDESVIDNEHLGRQKSNCCCIYRPPRDFSDPSSWHPDESETEHCRGHTLPPKQ